MKWLAQPLLILLLVVARPVSGEEKPPAAKLPVGQDTTVVDGPVRKDGYLDFEAALNGRLSKGVTPENNANVLLLKALGPKPEGATMPEGYFKLLGCDAPPEEGQYLVPLGRHLQALQLTPERLNRVLEETGTVTKNPWAPADHPQIAGWLELNEKPLALVVEATKRPEYFNPLVSRRNEDDPGSLIGALLPTVQRCRDAATMLSARAMLRTREGKHDAARADLIACHRLGRLVARGGTLIEALVGIAIDAVATHADLAHLRHARPSARECAAFLADLRALPAFPPLADKIDLGERFMFLDSVQLVRRGGFKALEGLTGDRGAAGIKPGDEKSLEQIDWGVVLRDGNAWYDRLAKITREPDRPARLKAFDEFEADLKAAKKEAADSLTLGWMKLWRQGAGKEAGKVVGKLIIGMLLPASGKVQGAYDRAAQYERNLHLAVALAAYHADAGKYPLTLAELAPKYLPEVPDDLYTGKPLTYRPTDGGYLLYSVGPDGKDDEGRSRDDTPPADDLRVRVEKP